MEDEIQGEKEVTLQSMADESGNRLALANSIFGITMAVTLGPIDDDETINTALAALGL